MHYLLTGGFLHISAYHGELEAIISKCTMMAPKDCYQSVDELADDLEKTRDTNNEDSAMEDKTPKELDNQEDRIRGITLSGSYAIPGFRTKKWWKMILAALGYFLIVDICFTMDIKSSVTPPFDVVDIWMELGCTFIFFIVSIFMIFNYRNCQSVLPFSKKIHYKWILVFFGIILTFSILLGILVVEVNIFSMF